MSPGTERDRLVIPLAVEVVERVLQRRRIALVVLRYGMTSGGLRAVHQLKPVVTALKMAPVSDTVVIHLRQSLDADGTLVPTDAMNAAAESTLDELLRVTPALASLRA